MTEEKREDWKILAKLYPKLRFPEVKLQVISPFNNTHEGKIDLMTFIPNKTKDRLTLYKYTYRITQKENIFTILKQVEERFYLDGDRIKEYFIFNKEHSIEEPNK